MQQSKFPLLRWPGVVTLMFLAFSCSCFALRSRTLSLPLTRTRFSLSKFMFAGYENEMTVVNILIKSKFGFWPVTIYFALVAAAPFVFPFISPPFLLCVFYFICTFFPSVG